MAAMLRIDWFGVVVPGRPVLANFVMVDAAKCVASIERPAEVSELCFFLLPAHQLPRSMCAALYYSVDGANYSVLGSVSAEKPSGIFRLPPASAASWAAASAAQIGVVLEPSTHAQNLDLVGSGVADRRSFARAIARDLMAFVTSFGRPPPDIVDRWLARFDAKYARDPNFFLKPA